MQPCECKNAYKILDGKSDGMKLFGCSEEPTTDLYPETDESCLGPL
jgi:hypothetical protein